MDRYQRNLSQFRNVSLSYAFAAATDWTGASVHELIAARVGETIFIQKIILDVLTDNAATQTWEDNAGTPVVIAVSKISPGLSGLGAITWDFGPEGKPCTEGKNLQHLMSAAGLAGNVTILAYQRRTATWVGNSAPNAPTNIGS